MANNWSHVGARTYLVRTQAGLKQAIKHYKGLKKGQRDDNKMDVYGYPKSYPAYVSIAQEYAGYFYIQLSSVPEHRLKEHLLGEQSMQRNTIPCEIIYVDPRYNSDAEEHEKFTKLTYGTPGAAAVDMCACIDEPVTIRAGEEAFIDTGVKIHIKDVNSAAFLLPRSGLGSKHGIVLGNLTGLIDSDYQGTWKIPLWNRNLPMKWDSLAGCYLPDHSKDFTIYPGDKLCQMTLVSIRHGEYTEVDEFTESTERGEGGFGHSGGAEGLKTSDVYRMEDFELGSDGSFVTTMVVFYTHVSDTARDRQFMLTVNTNSATNNWAKGDTFIIEDDMLKVLADAGESCCVKINPGSIRELSAS